MSAVRFLGKGSSELVIRELEDEKPEWRNR
jgi:hypothetical protein